MVVSVACEKPLLSCRYFCKLFASEEDEMSMSQEFESIWDAIELRPVMR